jgi:hypothetical protein
LPLLLRKNLLDFFLNETNLLKLSKDKTIDIALTEWNKIYKEIRTEKSGVCICQHKIKNIYFLYNKHTKNIITVGSDCYKKFGLKLNGEIKNPILYKIFNKILSSGEYQLINDLVQYVNQIETELLKYIEKEYNNILKYSLKINKLEDLLNNINDLIKNYDIEYLKEIYHEINNKILDLNNKQEENSNLLQENNNKKIFATQHPMENNKIYKNKYIINNNYCNCSIDICKCNNPRYEIIKVNNQLFCENCQKWKCRC